MFIYIYIYYNKYKLNNFTLFKSMKYIYNYFHHLFKFVKFFFEIFIQNNSKAKKQKKLN